MRKIILLVMICIFIPIHYGCNENSVNSLQAQGNVIMPLAIGNTWIGRLTKIDSVGNTLSVSYDTLKIIKDTLINGETWYVDHSNELFFRNSNWGLLTRNILNDCCDRPFLKFPCQLGELNMVDSLILQDEENFEIDTITFGIKVAKIDTLITVPLDTFNCIYYKPSSKKLDGTDYNYEVPIIFHYWYAPDVGQIKYIMQDFDSFESKNTIIWELIYLELH